MISNQILQNTIEGLKGIARVELCVMDVDGKEVAATMDMGNCSKPAVEFAASPADSQEIQGYQYFKIYDEQQLEYILVAGGTGEDVYMIGKMVAFQIQNLLVAYKERFDKDNFIKNLLLDNLLLVDIYSRSKKLHIQTDVPRVVMIVESAGGKDNNVLELARTHFGSNSKDFITAVDESNVIVVKEFAETDTGKEIEKSARALEAALLKEGIREIRIAYGTIVHEIKEVSRSYKEAKMALDVGKIFFDERDIIAYSELGIGRLIYQLPIPLCKMFIREIFGGKSPDDFDEETIIDLFGKAGAQMLIIDAIIGNGDRHAGNFGWIRNTDTGEYVCMAPLYDFDHALDSTLESDRLLTDAVKFCMPYEDEMVRIAGIAQGSENEVFKKRAQSILKLLDAGK